ncbi:hypothetical protein HaLaN_23737 [Haematococcus lacustris]|uniref:Uncharacterized protein n=1 Tax=Haematococcus lacustris TaxID=44745 RepID=A0A6A0A2I8_HAELA|nr:hypothetical protein HaLaN_23737 [Haematococcus lacustris]
MGKPSQHCCDAAMWSAKECNQQHHATTPSAGGQHGHQALTLQRFLNFVRQGSQGPARLERVDEAGGWVKPHR